MTKKTDYTWTVYKHYDSENTLLYVGCTADPKRRNREHKQTAPWFTQVARTETQTFTDKASGLAAELAAIQNQTPLHNQLNGHFNRAAYRRQYDANRRELKRAHYHANKDKNRQQRRSYRAAHRDQRTAYNRAWQAKRKALKERQNDPMHTPNL